MTIFLQTNVLVIYVGIQQVTNLIVTVYVVLNAVGKSLYEQAQVFLDASAGKKSLNK
jgi:hypothetical protein